MARIDHKDFYVYQHKEADTGRVFYVGRGRGKRITETGSKRSKFWTRTVQKHGGFIAEKVYENLSHDRANELEKMLISAYGRENLCNLTDGGEGMSGGTHTTEWRELMRSKMTGRKFSKEHCEKISASRAGEKHFNWGKKHKESTIRAMHGHGSNKMVCRFTHKDGREFFGTLNEWMHEFSLSKADSCNMSSHRDKGRYSHVKGWSVDRSWRG